MFQIAEQPITFIWPIDYVRPDPVYAGKHQHIRFDGKFALIDNDAWMSINSRLATARERLSQNPSEENIADLMREDRDAVKEIFLGWDEGQIKDSEGQDVPCNDGTIDYILNLAGMTQAISKAYSDARTGTPSKARKKT